jgi:hypothetical protein
MADVFIMELNNCDMVLGIQWLLCLVILYLIISNYMEL